MRKAFFHGVGGVLSADIAVPEHERELAFYSKVLTTGDVPLWKEDLMNNLGTPVIGLGKRVPEYEILPLHWTPHFQVADVATSVANAIELGGKELMSSDSEDPQSQWAGMLDPSGAAFGLIPVPSESDPAWEKDNIGNISWLSLCVSDADSIQSFYQKVIGWNASLNMAADDASSCFEMKADGDSVVAEIFTHAEGCESIPSVWMLHLPVGDLAESLRRVGEYGGKVVKEATESGSAVVRDPVGVCFALVENRVAT